MDATDPVAKVELRTKVKDEVRKIFDKRLSESKEKLDHAERRLAELKSVYERRKACSEMIIEERVKTLTTSEGKHGKQ